MINTSVQVSNYVFCISRKKNNSRRHGYLRQVCRYDRVLPGSKSMLFKVDPDPGKEIEVDPDPDPRRGSKWIRIRIRPNVVDPGGSGSGSGSETLLHNLQ